MTRRATLPILALLIATAFVWLGRKLLRTNRRASTMLVAIPPAAMVGAAPSPCPYLPVPRPTPDPTYFHSLRGPVEQLTGI